MEKHNDKLLNTPTIPSEVVENLPSLLRDGCVHFGSERERDVFLTAAIGVISGSLPGISGRYYNLTLHPNLYMVIVAPAANGKSNAQFGKAMGKALDKERRKPDDGQSLIKKRKNGQFLAANTSAARFIQQLHQNEGEGILFETEIDTLCNALSQDWGDFSSNLREAYQHEDTGKSRMTEDIEIRIEKPKVSMVLTGTLEQARKLFPSVENGLYSRVTFYVFRKERSRISVKPKSIDGSMEDYFLAKGQQVVELASFMEGYPSDFVLSDTQWNEFDDFINEVLDDTESSHGEDAFSPAMRLGICLFRIAMILSAIRKWEAQDTGNICYCSHGDFACAMRLAAIYLRHSMTMLELTPKTNVHAHKTKMERFIDFLPFEFTRIQAVEFGIRYQFSSSTIDRTLKRLIKEHVLRKQEHGLYQKVLLE